MCDEFAGESQSSSLSMICYCGLRLVETGGTTVGAIT